MSDQTNILPLLREDIRIEKGGSFLDGAPSWLIHDPLRNKFFRIGEVTFELLSLWQTVSVDSFCKLLETDFHRQIEKQEVEETVKFLYENQLTEKPPSDDYNSFHEQEGAGKKGLGATIIHSYLFFKIPLFNPQFILNACWPFVRFLFSKSALVLLSFMGLLALYLVSRQWEIFTTTFFSFLSFKGAVLYGLSLVLLKFLHEFGHGFMARKYNIPVPVIGVAFLVLFPVLYTDTTAAVRLKDRKQRLMIDMGGILVEFAVAILATLFWVFLPDGPMRSIAFTTATLSWVLSLAVNLNPFMRFDGYYILSDALGVENLQERGFTFARWQMREILFKPKLPPPEVVTLNLQRFLIVHAWGTWVYRFFLFLGIALLVYSFFIKLIGILLFIVEILWFILLPIWREVKNWWGSRSIYKTLRTLVSFSIFGLLLIAFFMPWSSSVDVPATLKSSSEFHIYPPLDGRLEYLNLKEGNSVKRGETLFEISSSQMVSERQISQKRIEMLKTRMDRSTASEDELSLITVTRQELETEIQKLTGLKKKQASLIVKSPFDGEIVNLDRELHEGQWLSRQKAMAIVIDESSMRLTGFAEASAVSRMKIGHKGTFIPDGFLQKSIPVEIIAISKIAEARLDDEILSEQEGGLIPSTQDKDGKLIPYGSWFKIELSIGRFEKGFKLQKTTRELVVIEGQPQSYATRVFRQIASVLIRESGF